MESFPRQGLTFFCERADHSCKWVSLEAKTTCNKTEKRDGSNASDLTKKSNERNSPTTAAALNVKAVTGNDGLTKTTGWETADCNVYAVRAVIEKHIKKWYKKQSHVLVPLKT